ncbi:MAG: hypothetical protein ACOC2W_00870 [bacterium]
MINKMMLLGLDPSLSSFGWFLFDTEGFIIIDYGYIPKKSRSESEQILNIYSVLKNILDIHGAVILLLSQYNLPYTYYSVMTLKSKILNGITRKKKNGKKKTAKEMKIEVANKIFDIFGKNNFIKDLTDDVTDAASAAVVYYLMEGIETSECKNKKCQTILKNNYQSINKIIGKEIYKEV